MPLTCRMVWISMTKGLFWVSHRFIFLSSNMGFLCSDDHLQETLSDAISNFHVMQHVFCWLQGAKRKADGRKTIRDEWASSRHKHIASGTLYLSISNLDCLLLPLSLPSFRLLDILLSFKLLSIISLSCCHIFCWSIFSFSCTCASLQLNCIVFLEISVHIAAEQHVEPETKMVGVKFA